MVYLEHSDPTDTELYGVLIISVKCGSGLQSTSTL